MRSLITGLVSLAVTAPAIVKATSLMPVKVYRGGTAGYWDVKRNPITDPCHRHYIVDMYWLDVEDNLWHSDMSAMQAARIINERPTDDLLRFVPGRPV